MKRIAITACLCLLAFASFADEYVNGYFKKDGTYVEGHFKTSPNVTNHDNYSTQYNVNPYTDTTGSRAPDYSPNAYNFGQGQIIYTGPKGGQYYISDTGRKVYVPKR